MKDKKELSKQTEPRWTKFKVATKYVDQDGEHEVPNDRVLLKNSRYQVYVRGGADTPPFGKILWLSIKRIDRQPVHDWRDLQRIKNEVVGKEVEAVEVYPAESRLVDTSNQYHLWCFIEGYRLPFGYRDRLVMDSPPLDDTLDTWAVQRPWDPDYRPPDATTPERARALLREKRK